MQNFRQILKNNPEALNEIHTLLKSGNNLPIAKRNGISLSTVQKVMAMQGPLNEFPRVEAMIQMHLRPALLIKNNKIEYPDSPDLRARLLPDLPKIESRVPSVGRIDFKKLGQAYGGTGWMVSEDVIVTNRLVANLFVENPVALTT